MTRVAERGHGISEDFVNEPLTRIGSFRRVLCAAAALLVVLAPTGSASVGVSVAAPSNAAVAVSFSFYTEPSVNQPVGITAGPDGALWFTNFPGNSIGRISTSGVVSNYTDPSISEPTGITAGPDGALWFTNFGGGNNPGSIGRIAINPASAPDNDLALSNLPGEHHRQRDQPSGRERELHSADRGR